MIAFVLLSQPYSLLMTMHFEMYLLSYQRQALHVEKDLGSTPTHWKHQIHTVHFWNDCQIISPFISWFLNIPTKIINFTHPLFITSNFSQIQAIYSVRYQKGTLNLYSNLPNSDRKQWSDSFEWIFFKIWRWVFIKTEDKFQVLWW